MAAKINYPLSHAFRLDPKFRETFQNISNSQNYRLIIDRSHTRARISWITVNREYSILGYRIYEYMTPFVSIEHKRKTTYRI